MELHLKILVQHTDKDYITEIILLQNLYSNTSMHPYRLFLDNLNTRKDCLMKLKDQCEVVHPREHGNSELIMFYTKKYSRNFLHNKMPSSVILSQLVKRVFMVSFLMVLLLFLQIFQYRLAVFLIYPWFCFS